ncbi:MULTISPECIES: ABC transporter permease [Streptococcus]|uniref:ABC transporter permease n=1 Tax=Streptococcus TaxID=1301 RepID=UPI00037A0B4C|nr:ABC transporter permease [Streptococcus entericus]
MSLILSTISQGLLWAVMVIGVYLTFRILDIADLTAEGTYPLGGAICAIAIVNGVDPILATLLAAVGGALAGVVAGLLHTKMKLPSLLTGIVVLTGLYSVNLKVLGKANLALLQQETLVSRLREFGLDKTGAVMVIGLMTLSIILAGLIGLLHTELGLALRSTGDNIPMSAANGINTDNMKIIAYALSNGLIALCGALLAQNNGYADINSGVGTIVIGLASIIIAEVLIRHLTLGWRLVSIVVGAVIYRLILLAILSLPGVDADMVKLFSAGLLAVVLYVPEVQDKLKLRQPRVR